MSTLPRMAWGLARHGLRTAVRRRTEGPLRPRWTFTFETLMRVFAEERDRFEADLASSWPPASSLAAPAGVWAKFRADMEAISLPSAAARKTSWNPEDAGGVGATWCVPPDVSDVVVLYLHGGGFTGGSVRTHRDLVARIALASSARVLVPEYRLAPEHRFPAALDDVVAAWRWLTARVPPSKVVVMGDSAGGGLVLGLLQVLRGEAMPAAGVCLSPWVDLRATAASIGPNRAFDWCSEPGMHGQRAAWLGDHDPADPRVCALEADLSGLPPLLIHVGGAEMLRDDGVRVAERARAAGVDVTLKVWDDMPHVFQVFADLLPEARESIAEVGRWLRDTGPPAKSTGWPRNRRPSGASVERRAPPPPLGTAPDDAKYR